jgi:hypothetical protein
MTEVALDPFGSVGSLCAGFRTGSLLGYVIGMLGIAMPEFFPAFRLPP